MKQRILGLWRYVLPRVRVGGVWKDVDTGWIKVDGVFRKFKYPFVGKGVLVNLFQFTLSNGHIRRSYTNYVGSVSQLDYDIDGVTYRLRGIETGSDVVGGQPGWEWVSVQFFGQVDTRKMAKVINFNGYSATYVTQAYNPDENIHYIIYRLETPYIPPTGANLPITF